MPQALRPVRAGISAGEVAPRCRAAMSSGCARAVGVGGFALCGALRKARGSGFAADARVLGPTSAPAGLRPEVSWDHLGGFSAALLYR